MDSKLKLGVYNKIVNALNANPNISGLHNEQKDNFLINCNICGGISFEFTLRGNTDLMIIKSNSPVIEGLDESGVAELGAEIVENTNIRYINYDDKLTFQLVVPFIDESEKPVFNNVEGQKMLFNETLGFVQLMCKYKDRLGCSGNSSSIDIDFTNEGEDDPYGFNDFSDGGINSPADKAETDSGDEFDVFSGIPVDKDEPEEDLSFIFGEGMTMPETNTAETVHTEENDDVSAKLKEMEEKRAAREKRREQRKKEKSKTVSVQEKRKTRPAKPANNGSNNDSKLPESVVREMDDIFGDIFEGTTETVAATTQKKPRPAPKPVPKPVKKEKSKPPHAVGISNNKGVKPMVRENKNGTEIPQVKYERAPEVVEQMKHLYSEIDVIFEKRKSQMDYREQTLDTFKEQLDKREKELEVRAARLENNHAMLQEEYEKKILDLETQEQEIKFQWKKLESDQEMLEHKKKDLQEEQDIIEKQKELANAVQDDEKEAIHKHEVEELKKEIAKLKDEKDEVEAGYQEQIRCLKEELDVVGQNADSAEKVETLQAKVASMEEDIEFLNNDINDLNEEAKQKDEIIDILQKKQSDWQGKSEAWAAKEVSYKEQIKTAKAATSDNGQSAELQDELDAANMKIKELEAEIAKKPDISASDDEEVKKLNNEIDRLQTDLKKANEEWEKAKDALEKAASDKPASVDTNKLAVSIKDSLSEIGIQVEPVATNGELVLSGYSDVVKVIINVDAGVLYISKPVKRGIKHRGCFEKWNQEDIRTSYLFDDKNILCKCVYDDVAKAAMDILGRFEGLH